MSSVIVVDAGVGGIAIAGRLAKAGYQVAVLEKTERPGGRASTIEDKGFFFDTGPSLFLMPLSYAETYVALGERMEDHLDLARIDPTYRLHFHDGSHIDLTGDLLHMREQLEAMEPGSFDGYMRFVTQGYHHYSISLDRFVGRNFRSWSEFFHPANAPLLFQLHALERHYAHTSRYLQDPRLRAAFSFQNMYMGLSPYDAPATYTLLQYTELAEGVWYPRAGMYSIITSLTSLAQKCGAQFRHSAPVSQIDVEGSRVVGVALEGGERLKADLVVANADLPYVYANLLPENGLAARLANKRYTSSTLMF